MSVGNAFEGRRKAAVLVVALVPLGVLPSTGGCSEQEEPTQEVRNCDIAALFAANCAGSACHGSDGRQGDLDLVSPGVERRLFHVESTESCGEQKLVDPGNPYGSLLYQKVARADPPCGEKMPPRRTLSDTAIACLEDYIERAGLSADGTKCETCGGILCVDFDRDPAHCGGCGLTCAAGQVCGEGRCLNPCTQEKSLCGAACVTLENDDSHCGRCGHRCGPGSRCVEGSCACDASSSGEGGAGGESNESNTGHPPTFQADILPLFENSCSGAECHIGTNRTAPLDLDPQVAYEHLVNITAESCAAQRLVVPGSPDSSYLVDKLMGGQLCEGSRMPLSGDPLPNAAIGRVVGWICSGAPNN